jgi:ABC-2 type transport system permease protein
LNIYLFELRAQIKSFIIWTIVLLSALFAFMVGIYPVFYQSLDEVLQMLKGFPPEFAAAFGLNIADFFSYNGFFCFVYSYIAIIGAIMATSLALSTFAREKRSKCVDFLLTKPKNRGNIFCAKLLSNLTILVITNIAFIVTVVIMYRSANEDASLVGKFVLAASGLFFAQLVFLAVGILYATFAKKVRSVSGIATAFGFAGFILSALVGILKEEAIRYIAPLKYFDPIAVFASGGYEGKYVATAVIVIAVSIGLSYVKYCKSDAHAV